MELTSVRAPAKPPESLRQKDEPGSTFYVAIVRRHKVVVAMSIFNRESEL